jgi:selenocysteine lyase/cysteine desulfurase
VSSIDVARVRAGIPALAETIYLNTGTFGPLPRVVADEIRRVYGQIERCGTFSPPIFQALELEGLEAVRRKIAALMHAAPDEIAFTHNVTDGINIVLHGLDWSPGDRVIISDQEHPAGTVPWLALAERRGVVVDLLPVGHDPDAVVARFRVLVACEPHPRLACLSHVSCLSGTRLPVARLCAVARAADVLTLIDGAHAEGQFPVDVPQIGPDFYAACGHKWLLGPQGTGMLYVRRERLDDLSPVWLGWGVHKPLDRVTMRYTLEPTAARFEQSTQPWPLYLALGRAVDHIQEIGLDSIQARVRQLVAHFRGRLSEISDVTFYTPEDPNACAGLLTVAVPGWHAETLGQHLWRTRRILTNFIQEFDALRFSVAFFNTREELDVAAEVLAEAAAQGERGD